MLTCAVALGLTVSVAGAVAAIVVGAVGVVVAGIVRGAGRRTEATLWQSWGGSPTTRRLRWRDPGNAPESLAVLHARLENVVQRHLPTADEEQENPAAADAAYDDAVRDIRDLTRDGARYPLVAAENAEYGFRRNSYGLRRLAVMAALTSLSMDAVALVLTWRPIEGWVVSCLVAAVCLLYWLLLVRPEWVHEAAERYAERLLESVTTLAQ